MKSDGDARRIDLEMTDGPYRRLPEPIRVEDTVAIHDADPPPDPTGGRDPETDFMLRYAN
jgi:hypothetical protein